MALVTLPLGPVRVVHIAMLVHVENHFPAGRTHLPLITVLHGLMLDEKTGFVGREVAVGAAQFGLHVELEQVLQEIRASDHGYLAAHAEELQGREADERERKGGLKGVRSDMILMDLIVTR